MAVGLGLEGRGKVSVAEAVTVSHCGDLAHAGYEEPGGQSPADHHAKQMFYFSLDWCYQNTLELLHFFTV